MTPRPKDPRVALYVRVSTEDQSTNGVSLNAQEEKLRAYAIAKDWEVVKVYADRGQSARTLERPALSQLRKDAGTLFHTVLIYKLDRLVRSVIGLGTLIEEFQKKDVSLVSLSDSIDASTASGRLVLHMLGSVAQWEREAVGERTSLALQHKRANLKVYGTTPYGFRRVGDRLDPLTQEIRVVKQIHSLREEGHTLREIAECLNDQGVPTKTRSKKGWGPETIRIILNNSALYGRYLSSGQR